MVRIATSTSVPVAPTKGALPVNISRRTTAHAPEIRAGVHLRTPRLLWRHISIGAHHYARLGTKDAQFRRGVLFADVKLGHSKVQQLHQSVGAKHDVFRLDVAVNDAGLMGCGERRGKLARNPQRFLDRDRSRQPLPQSDSLHMLHGDVVIAAFRLVDLVNDTDIGMRQSRCSPRLLLKAAQLVAEEIGIPGQKLQRNPAMQSGI